VSSWNFPLHDAEILALENRQESRLLELRLRMPDGSRASLEFKGTEGWEFSPFREQNVMLDMYVWSALDEGTPGRCRELEVLRVWVEAIMKDQVKLYEIDPSVGLGGYVVAKSVEIKLLGGTSCTSKRLINSFAR